MKTALLLLSLIIVAVACNKKSTPAGTVKEGAVALGACRSQIFENDEVKICYDSLINDSRCPANVVCVWEGMAVAKFSFLINANKHTLTLSTKNIWQFSRDTIVGNYKIELLDIDPYPGVHPAPPASASVKIRKL